MRLSVFLLLVVFDLLSLKLKASDKVIAMYNFDFSSSFEEKKINQVVFEKAYYHWWQMLLGYKCPYHRNKIDSLFKKIEKRYLDQGISKTSLDTFYFMQTASFRLRSEMLFHNQFKPASQMLNLLGDIKKILNGNKFPEHYILLSGLFSVAFHELREKYNFYYFLFSFLLPEGDKKTGIEMLENCTGSSDKLISTEANYFLFKIYNIIELDYKKALKYIKRLKKKYPNNMVFLLDYYEVLNKVTTNSNLKFDIFERIENHSYINTYQKKYLLNRLEDVKIKGKGD